MKFKKMMRLATFKILVVFIASNLNMVKANRYDMTISCLPVDPSTKQTTDIPQVSDYSAGYYKFMIPYKSGGCVNEIWLNIPLQDIVITALAEIFHFRMSADASVPSVFEFPEGHGEAYISYCGIIMKVDFSTGETPNSGASFKIRAYKHLRALAFEMPICNYGSETLLQIRLSFFASSPSEIKPLHLRLWHLIYPSSGIPRPMNTMSEFLSFDANIELLSFLNMQKQNYQLNMMSEFLSFDANIKLLSLLNMQKQNYQLILQNLPN
jgi:hypothetical protein